MNDLKLKLVLSLSINAMFHFVFFSQFRLNRLTAELLSLLDQLKQHHRGTDEYTNLTQQKFEIECELNRCVNLQSELKSEF